MYSTLDKFLIERLSDLESEESGLRKALGENLAEQDKVRRAANAAGVDLISKITSSTFSRSAQFIPPAPHHRHPSLKTIKEAVVSVLSTSLFGMTALEILDEINKRHGMDYPRTSLSPQLSRLKNEGIINKDGKVWCLVNSGTKKDRAPNANALEPQNIPDQRDQTGAVKSPEIGAPEWD
jgi:hypothetical protein